MGVPLTAGSMSLSGSLGVSPRTVVMALGAVLALVPGLVMTCLWPHHRLIHPSAAPGRHWGVCDICNQ